MSADNILEQIQSFETLTKDYLDEEQSKDKEENLLKLKEQIFSIIKQLCKFDDAAEENE